jgi:hypothetical protein
LKILVDELPSTCSSCLFLGGILESGNTYTGCTLLKIKIPFQIGISTKLGNCPLKVKQLMK